MRGRVGCGWSGARGRLRFALAWIVSAVLVAGSLPAEASNDAGPAEAEDVRFFEHGGDLFRLDYGDALVHGTAALRTTGEFSVLLSRAAPGASFDDSEWRRHGFALDEGLAAERFTDLGSDAPRALARAGRDTRAELRWEEVVRWTVTSAPGHVTSTFAVGPDRASLTVPRELLAVGASALPPDAAIVVEVNGIAARVDGALVEGLRALASCPGTPLPAGASRELRALGESFIDLPRFMNHVQGYLAMETLARVKRALASVPRSEDPVLASCVSSCLSCAGSLLASAGAYIALVAACGSSLVTGGSTALICIAAFLGVQSSHLLVFGACASCVECGTEPDCPCEGQPLCDCG